MGDPRRLRKKYEKPFKRWDKQRIIEERKLMEAYGLKNKKELWKLQTILRKYRHMARKFVGMPEEEKKEKEDTTKDFEAILKQMKEVLGDKVSEVRVTNRLTDSPACLVTGDHDMSLNMERIMKEAGQSMNMMGMGGSKPIFEINPTHALVTSIKNEQDDERFSDITNVLFDQAILSEGGQLDDPAAFVHKLNGLLLGLLK